MRLILRHVKQLAPFTLFDLIILISKNGVQLIPIELCDGMENVALRLQNSDCGTKLSVTQFCKKEKTYNRNRLWLRLNNIQQMSVNGA